MVVIKNEDAYDIAHAILKVWSIKSRESSSGQMQKFLNCPLWVRVNGIDYGIDSILDDEEHGIILSTQREQKHENIN